MEKEAAICIKSRTVTGIIQNIIPTIYLGTTTFAAPILGIICGTLLIVLCFIYLEWRRKHLKKAGEGYGHHTVNETEIDPNAPCRRGPCLLYRLSLSWRLTSFFPLCSTGMMH